MKPAVDTQFMMVVLILPSLFGLSLLGEGVHRVMSYDNRGWIGVIIGVVFIAVVVFAYFFVSGSIA